MSSAKGPPASVRRVHTTVFKVTGRLRRAVARQSGTSVRQTWAVVRDAEAVVRGAGAFSVTGQRGKVLVSTHLPSRQAQTDGDGTENISGYSVIEAWRAGDQMDAGGLEQPAVQQ